MNVRFIELIYAGMGGFIGAALRQMVNIITLQITPKPYPIATLLVNVIGCFLIGILGGYFDGRVPADHPLRFFLIVGILGGFTTFSAFTYEVFNFYRAEDYIGILLHVFLHLGLCFVAVILGFFISDISF